MQYFTRSTRTARRSLCPPYDVAEWFEKHISLEDDFVVVKMDIEGAEWSVIQHMMRRGVWRYVDELFLECHHVAYGKQFKKKYSDCKLLMEELRLRYSVSVHPWEL